MVDMNQGLILPVRGTWTPVLTAATPGNLTIVYGPQSGRYEKLGRLVNLWFRITTNTYTHTTASGAIQVTGNPFTSDPTEAYYGAMAWNGFTKAGYTQVVPRIQAATTIVSFSASGSGVTRAALNITDFPTGGVVDLYGHIAFEADS